ncbi:hypothetical protein VTJ83DRAFT_3607 [Remersonia thermophila]|uniref:Alpha/beta hydrolase fold-3 domain-containing protein n=1 Tax=Remersonia thermophila TaxID=72144 RepID=A0ABR4DFZ0_9PEZI
MSSRLTTPISKLARSISTSAPVARPSRLLNNAGKTASARKQNLMADEAAPAERHHSTSSTSVTSPHRPLVRQKPLPFMQTFHHSAPRPSPPSFATVDRAVLPRLDDDVFLSAAGGGAAPWEAQPLDFAGTGTSAPGRYDPYAHIRVPLLPDRRSASASAQASGFHAPEAVDAPLPKPEIVVVAADPTRVLPAALTEVEGMGVDGVELKFAHEEAKHEESYEMGPGMIRDLWKGMVDDVLGSSKAAKGGPATA